MIRLLRISLTVFVLFLLCIRFRLAFSVNINWDEYLFLERIYLLFQSDSPSLAIPLHYLLFMWLPWIEGHEAAQIIWGRYQMLLLFFCTCFFTYRLSRYYHDHTTSVFVLLCYLSFSNIVVHATSLRVDPYLSFFFLLALLLLVRALHQEEGAKESAYRIWPRIPGLVLAALAVALALAASPKSVFHFGTLLVFVLLSKSPHKFMVGGIFFIAWFMFMMLGSAVGRVEFGSDQLSQLNPTRLEFLFLGRGEEIHRYFFRKSFDENIYVWSLLVAGAVGVAIAPLRKGEGRRASELLPLVFMLPLVPLLFYRGSFPYFYVSILSPAVILAGFPFSRLLRRCGTKAQTLIPCAAVAVLVALVFGSGVRHSIARLDDENVAQKETLIAVHRMFPAPVDYIDRCSMVSSFRKQGFFMESLRMRKYRENGIPVFGSILDHSRPQFLLANSPALDFSRSYDSYKVSHPNGLRLFEEDWRLLDSNFVHHWGHIYVPGKTLQVYSMPAQRVSILIEGTYTVESASIIVIDGKRVQAGEAVHLSRGVHTVRSTNASPHTVTLRWGKNLFRPGRVPSSKPLFTQF